MIAKLTWNSNAVWSQVSMHQLFYKNSKMQFIQSDFRDFIMHFSHQFPVYIWSCIINFTVIAHRNFCGALIYKHQCVTLSVFFHTHTHAPLKAQNDTNYRRGCFNYLCYIFNSSSIPSVQGVLSTHCHCRDWFGRGFLAPNANFWPSFRSWDC